MVSYSSRKVRRRSSDAQSHRKVLEIHEGVARTIQVHARGEAVHAIQSHRGEGALAAIRKGDLETGLGSLVEIQPYTFNPEMDSGPFKGFAGNGCGDIRQCWYRLRIRWQRERRQDPLQFGYACRVGRQRVFRVDDGCQDVGVDIIIVETFAGGHDNAVITGIDNDR